jgi:hypothetical protein
MGTDNDTQEKCPGCGRPEQHKMCPAWGTPVYMTGELLTPELEEKYRFIRQESIRERFDFTGEE